jgi:hypothetical protein
LGAFESQALKVDIIGGILREVSDLHTTEGDINGCARASKIKITFIACSKNQYISVA